MITQVNRILLAHSWVDSDRRNYLYLQCLDDLMECAVSKFADDTKLGGVAVCV